MVSKSERGQSNPVRGHLLTQLVLSKAERVNEALRGKSRPNVHKGEVVIETVDDLLTNAFRSNQVFMKSVK